MRLAPGWPPWVLSPLALAVLAALWKPWLSAGLVLLASGMAAFFRDPDREVGDGLVAAADGLVREVGDGRVVTFLNVHNVHVIRTPLAGTVTRIERFSGGHVPAFLGGAKHNAGVRVGLQTEDGRAATVHLIAGLIARRAVPFVREGDRVDRGQRIGMIRFGSRVDVDLPAGAVPAVDAGDRVWAGRSTIAREEVP